MEAARIMGRLDRRCRALLAELFAQLFVRIRSRRKPPLGHGDDRLAVERRAHYGARALLAAGLRDPGDGTLRGEVDLIGLAERRESVRLPPLALGHESD